MDIPHGLKPKYLTALVSGICKKNFGGDSTITHEYLYDEVLAASGSELSQPDCFSYIEALEAFLVKSAYEGLSPSRMEKQLAEIGSSSEDIDVIVQYWNNERHNIQNQLAKSTTWNSTLKSIDWRVDVVASSKHVKDVHEPVGIVKVELKEGNGNSMESVTFDIDKTTMAKVVKQLDAIQAVLSPES